MLNIDQPLSRRLALMFCSLHLYRLLCVDDFFFAPPLHGTSIFCGCISHSQTHTFRKPRPRRKATRTQLEDLKTLTVHRAIDIGSGLGHLEHLTPRESLLAEPVLSRARAVPTERHTLRTTRLPRHGNVKRRGIDPLVVRAGGVLLVQQAGKGQWAGANGSSSEPAHALPLSRKKSYPVTWVTFVPRPPEGRKGAKIVKFSLEAPDDTLVCLPADIAEMS